jgi:hypothetical protein
MTANTAISAASGSASRTATKLRPAHLPQAGQRPTRPGATAPQAGQDLIPDMIASFDGRHLFEVRGHVGPPHRAQSLR